jgi:hypothetical protein
MYPFLRGTLMGYVLPIGRIGYILYPNIVYTIDLLGSYNYTYVYAIKNINNID